MAIVYFCIPSEDVPDLSTVEKMLITAKPVPNFVVKDGADEIGTYWDGMAYSASATFSSGASLTGRKINLIWKGPIDPKNVMGYFVGTPPANGARLEDPVIYDESAGSGDDSICVQDGVTYTKYTATVT